MGYLFIVIASVSVGGQFALSKVYKNKIIQSNYTDLFFNFGMGAFSMLIFAVICLGNVGFSWYSFGLAAGVALCNVAYMLCNLRAVMYGKLAVFTMFLMLGGMIFPTIFGVLFLGETMSWFKIAGVVLLVFSMIFSVTEKTGEKNSKKFYLLCFIAFVCNGLVSIFSKVHQISENALDTFQFSFWQSVVVAASVGILLLICAATSHKQENFALAVRQTAGAKSLGLIFLITVIMRAGSVLMLFAAKDVPASLLYPLMTGISIVVTAVFGRIFFAERISKINFISLCIDTAAVILMSF